jgi:YidC/Oxa1 family membrane protein insertase
VSILNPLFDAVAWVMMQIHAGLSHLFGASSGATWALSIVLLVVLMRLIMVPLFIKQRNSMQKMQSHMPQLQEIRKKYKSDKTRLNEETMKFYKENGINPLGGCLPLLAQLPVFWSLFNVLKAIAQWAPAAAGQVQSQPKYGLTIPVVTSARNARIFGISLYDQFLHPAAGETLTSRLLIVVFVLVSAATTFMTMRQSQRRGMMNQTAPDPDQPGAAAAASMSKNMMYIAPFFALTGLYWQFGLVLYWVTTNVWTLGQQHFLFRKLPVVGSTTVGASATQAASGPTGAARTPSAKTAAGRTPAAKSAAARNGSASSAAKARSGAPAKAGSGTAAKAGSGTAAKAGSGTAARPAAGAAKAASGAPAKAGSGAPAKAAAATGEAKTSGAKEPAAESATAKAPAKAGASGSATAAAPAAKAAAAPAPKAKANGNGAASNGAARNGTASNGASNGAVNGAANSVRRLLGRSKEEPQEVPAAPPTKTVRQQPVRQPRSKRGTTGKR